MQLRRSGRWAISPGASLLRAGPAARWWCLRMPYQRSPGREFGSRSKAQPLMSERLRRFELLLPLRFNDGQPVPDDLIADTLLELRQQFGAVSSETQVIRGIWEHQ